MTDTPVLILSQYVEERYASDLIAGGASGVGYLLKERVADVGEFVANLKSVAAGGTVLDPEVVKQILVRRRRDDRIVQLSEREREVLGLMAEGRSNSAIAERLFVSEGTIEKHIKAIFSKLNLTGDEADHRRVLAVLAYLRAG